jgi:sugar diacid utilization regulator
LTAPTAPTAANVAPAIAFADKGTTQPQRAIEFMRHELGPLAAAHDCARRQRETLGTFLASGMNFRATAAMLGRHHSTIRYRLEKVKRYLP